MKRKTLLSVIVVTLAAGFLTLVYGLNLTLQDHQANQTVAAATKQVDQLFENNQRQLPAQHLSKQQIETAQKQVAAAIQVAATHQQRTALLAAQQDVDAAKHMLTIKEAVADTTPTWPALKQTSQSCQKAYEALATRKPTFATQYVTKVVALTKREQTIAKVADLFTDDSMKTLKQDVTPQLVSQAMATLETLHDPLSAQLTPALSQAQAAMASSENEAAASRLTPSSSTASSSDSASSHDTSSVSTSSHPSTQDASSSSESATTQVPSASSH